MIHRVLALVSLLVVLAACGGGGAATGTVEWRDLEITLADGWSATVVRGDLLSASDSDLGRDLSEEQATSIDPDDNDVVALEFTHRPRVTADQWRELVTSRDGTIEADEAIEVGGLPATSIVFSWVTNSVPTRERVVLVPGRGLELLFLPLPVQGQTSGPQVYLDNADTFEQMLSSITFGAPVDD